MFLTWNKKIKSLESRSNLKTVQMRFKSWVKIDLPSLIKVLYYERSI